MKAKSSGFTLIELIVVIVILGILAVVAMPRFISMSKEANVATLEGLSGAVHDAIELAHDKAVIEGKQDEPSYTIDGYGSLQYGYPAVNKQGLVEFMNFDGGYHDLTKEWVWAAHNNGNVNDPDYWIATHSSYLKDYTGSDFNSKIMATECYVQYVAPMQADDDYKLVTIIDGCK
ncbi:type II secretion system protein [Vibrio sp. LaRot3]|uniref:type II secretion system protein n=1 Tax=Vibrio sp. LaRot3 TaxID=2998829 RepID=UPI0022CE2597|nr:type II secretion system protein [Vibrio sp. LaRot3]MDA0147045.1 type II secretion system protein [Vibrio sp. LaRot3]